MRNSVRIMAFLGLALLLAGGMSEAAGSRGRKPPGPSLAAPGDNVSVADKSTVQFRWSPEGDRSNFDHYDFRLYKGHEPVESGLILQKNIPMGQNSIDVDSSLLSKGETYAWSVRQEGSMKSRVSYSVFRVVD